MRKKEFVVAILFVLIWSTGSIVGRNIVGTSDPNVFTFLRLMLAGAFFIIVSSASRQRWPPLAMIPKHCLAGVLANGLYLGGNYWAIAQGLPASVMALIGALQPVFTAVLATALLGAALNRSVVVGLSIAIGGVLLTLYPLLVATDAAAISLPVASIAAISVLALAAGTLMQKTSIGKADLAPSMAIQSISGAAVALLILTLLDEHNIVWGPRLYASLIWAVMVLSGVGTYLLMWLVRTGNATQATSLLLLSPPLAAIEVHLLFGEVLTPLQILGFAITLIGVYACRRRAHARAARDPHTTVASSHRS